MQLFSQNNSPECHCSDLFLSDFIYVFILNYINTNFLNDRYNKKQVLVSANLVPTNEILHQIQ